jgi:transketolase
LKIENHLIRRCVDIDYRHRHRHLAGALSVLPILCEIAADFDPQSDTLILSKGHAASALYAVLEALGYSPDVSRPHPERAPAAGIPCTTGSLGHGLPIGLGLALARSLRGQPGRIHVVLGDGECLEGTTWEALHLADHLGLHRILTVWIDANGWQGSCPTITRAVDVLAQAFPVRVRTWPRGHGVPLYERHPEWHTHTITEPEYHEIVAALPTP